MNLMVKIELRRYFRKKEYKKIYDMMYWTPKIVKEFDQNQIEILIDYSIKKHGNYYLFLLIPVATKEQRNKIINYLTNTKTYVDESHITSKYLYEFLEESIKNKNNYLMLRLSLDIAAKKEPNLNLIHKIKEYYQNLEVNNAFICIASKDIYYCDEFSKKIISSGIENIIKYYKNLNDSTANDFLTKYFHLLNNNDIENLIFYFKDDKIKFNIIVKHIYDIYENNELKSNYLYLVFKAYPEYNENITKDIIELNDITTIKKLIKLLNEDYQNEIAKNYIEKNDTKTILNLAISTDCIMTYKLIDYILEENDLNKIVYLISNIEKRFLTYTLDKIIKIKGIKYYINIINKLYLYGLPNILEVINFIFIYKLDHLFEKELINKFIIYKNKEENQVKKLTLNTK